MGFARSCVSHRLFRAACNGGVGSAIRKPALFDSRQLTPSGEYTFGIEGPAVDAAGHLYVVEFPAARHHR